MEEASEGCRRILYRWQPVLMKGENGPEIRIRGIEPHDFASGMPYRTPQRIVTPALCDVHTLQEHNGHIFYVSFWEGGGIRLPATACHYPRRGQTGWPWHSEEELYDSEYTFRELFLKAEREESRITDPAAWLFYCWRRAVAEEQWREDDRIPEKEKMLSEILKTRRISGGISPEWLDRQEWLSYIRQGRSDKSAPGQEQKEPLKGSMRSSDLWLELTDIVPYFCQDVIYVNKRLAAKRIYGSSQLPMRTEIILEQHRTSVRVSTVRDSLIHMPSERLLQYDITEKGIEFLLLSGRLKRVYLYNSGLSSLTYFWEKEERCLKQNQMAVCKRGKIESAG